MVPKSQKKIAELKNKTIIFFNQQIHTLGHALQV